jgi:uncharacterized protein YuzE
MGARPLVLVDTNVIIEAVRTGTWAVDRLEPLESHPQIPSMVKIDMDSIERLSVANGKAHCRRGRQRGGAFAPPLGYHRIPGSQALGRRDRMGTKLTFRYDREADILHIDKCPPYAEQESEELGDDVIARLNPQSGEIENLEVVYFATRLLRHEFLEIPVEADLRLVTPLRG